MNQEIIYEEYGSRRKYSLLSALCLMLPVILKVLMPSGIESHMTPNIFGIYVFAPNLLLFLFFMLSDKNKRNWRLQILYILEIVVMLFSFITNEYTGGMVILFSGTFYFYAITIGISCKTTIEERHWIGILSSATVILLDIEVALYATGILHSYNNNLITGQLYGGYYRINTTVGAATGTACIIYLLTVVSVALVTNRKIRLGVFIAGVIATLMTVSRGGIVAFLVYFLLWLLQLMKKSKKKRYQYIIFAVLIAVAMYQLGLFDGIIARNINVQSSSYGLLSGRDAHIKSTLDSFEQNGNPLLGCGISNVFPSNELRAALGNGVQLRYSNAPHNVYILFLAEQGWIGVILFVLFWLTVLKKVSKAKSILYALLPILFVLFNTETVMAVDSEYILLVSLLLMLGLDNEKIDELQTL